MGKIGEWLDGRKRNIGLTLTLVLAWVHARGYIDSGLYQLALGLLTIWGIVAVSDAVRKEGI